MDGKASRRVALVTGGAKGIGRAITCHLAKTHVVIATYLTTEPDLPQDVITVRSDLREPDAPASVVAEVLGICGRLDVIVNNAGKLQRSDVGDYPMANLREMFDVNVLAAQGLLAAALPNLTRGASIVSISSVNACLPPKGAALYGATKAALDLWTRGCAKELGPKGIRVNAVAPGAVNIPEAPRAADLTAVFEDLTALGRLPEPQDIAQAVGFLVSDAARSITGEVLTVSGGYRL